VHRSTLGPEVAGQAVQNLSLFPNQSTFLTNPQVSPVSCLRLCQEEQYHKTRTSLEGSPIKNLETPAQAQDSPVLETEQASTETSPLSKQTPITQPALKRKATTKQGLAPKPAEEPTSKRAKTSVTPSPKLEKFLKRGVVRGKIVKIGYFREQGLEVFLDKFKDKGWLELFTNIQMGCS